MKNRFIAMFFVGLASLAIAAQSKPEQSGSTKNPGALGQQAGVPQVVVVAMTKSLEANKAKTGDLVSTQVVADTWIDEKTTLPAQAKLLGHVLEAQGRTKDNPQSKMSIVFDKAVLSDGQEVPVNVVMVHVAPPPQRPAIRHPSEAPFPSANDTMARAAGPVATDRGGVTPQAVPDPIGASYNASALFQNAGAEGLEGLELAGGPRKSESVSYLRSNRRNVRLDKGCRLSLKVVSTSH